MAGLGPAQPCMWDYTQPRKTAANGAVQEIQS